MTKHSIVCPFCPLHCDDLEVDCEGRTNVACQLAESGFHQAMSPPAPRIGSHSASREELAEVARTLFVQSRQVIVVTAGTDLQSARMLQQLQMDLRVTVQYESTPTRRAMASAISRDGVVAATLGELRCHADRVWMLGICPERVPRAVERIQDPRRPAEIIDWPQGASADHLATLSSKLVAVEHGEVFDRPTITDTPELDRLLAEILRSRYFAVLVGDAAFAAVEAEAAAVMLLGIVSRLNTSRRAVITQLDPAQTNRAVTAWSSNRPLDLGLHAPDMLTESGADLPSHLAPGLGAGEGVAVNERGQQTSVPRGRVLIRLGNANGTRPTPVALQIGGADPGPESAACYMPAATVGVDRPGIVVRGDGTVTLPLQCIRETDELTPAEWIRYLWSESPNRMSPPCLIHRTEDSISRSTKTISE